MPKLFEPNLEVLLRNWTPFTKGGAFPYVIEYYTALVNVELREKVYILVVRFEETGEYDIGFYSRKERELTYALWGCQHWAESIVWEYKKKLEREGKKVVEWEHGPKVREYDNFPRPPVPNSYVNGSNWEPIINMVLRAKSRKN